MIRNKGVCTNHLLIMTPLTHCLVCTSLYSHTNQVSCTYLVYTFMRNLLKHNYVYTFFCNWNLHIITLIYNCEMTVHQFYSWWPNFRILCRKHNLDPHSLKSIKLQSTKQNYYRILNLPEECSLATLLIWRMRCLYWLNVIKLCFTF